jgi:nickel-type superoxide dismutase maturation protease
MASRRARPGRRPARRLRRRLWRRVAVVGTSMAPALAEGDRLLVLGWLRWRPGDVVALSDPVRPGLVLVKRVVSAQAGRIEVAGDNAAASRDSRDFGPVAPGAILGRAVYRYHPPERAGRVVRPAPGQAERAGRGARPAPGGIERRPPAGGTPEP